MSHIGISNLPYHLGQHSVQNKQEAVSIRFGHLLDGVKAPEMIPSLYPFTIQVPLCYVSDKAASTILHLLSKYSSIASKLLPKLEPQLTHALQSILRPGSSWKNEHRLENKAPKDLEEFEQIWHPEYQRYVEHIYNHLIRLPLEIYGTIKNKDYGRMTLSNRAKMLSELGLKELTIGFNSVVRNAISHGTITFTQFGVLYADRNKDQELLPSDFAQLFDNLISICHGITVGLIAWVCHQWPNPTPDELHALPMGLKRLLVQGWVSYPGLQIESVIELMLGLEKNLNVYCTSDTSSQIIHQIDALAIASTFQRYGGGDYNKIMVHIDCGKKVASLAILDCGSVKELRESGLKNEILKKTFEGSMMWHDSSNFRRRLWLWTKLLKMALKKWKQNVIKEWRRQGLAVWGARYKIKNIENRSAGKIRRLHVDLVLNYGEEVSKSTVRGVLTHAARKLKRRLFYGEKRFHRTFLKRPPVYIWFHLHARNVPLRSLGLNGWDNKDALAQAEWRAWPKTIRHPILVKAPDEIYRGLLIRYNPKYKVRD